MRDPRVGDLILFNNAFTSMRQSYAKYPAAMDAGIILRIFNESNRDYVTHQRHYEIESNGEKINFLGNYKEHIRIL